MNEGRRTLRYNTIDDIMPDVESLLRGHTVVGNWSLAQTCHHLAKAMRRIVDLPASTPSDPSLWVSPERKQAVFDSGLLEEGLAAPAETLPPDGSDPREEAENLRNAIAHYKASSGPQIPHRFFGPLSKPEWDKLQLIHCAHHLSFAIPNSV